MSCIRVGGLHVVSVTVILWLVMTSARFIRARAFSLSKRAAYFAAKDRLCSSAARCMTEGDDDTLTPEFSPHPHPFIRWECSGLMVLFKPATAVKTSSTNAVMPGVNLKASLYHYMTPLLNESSLIRAQTNAPVRLKRSD